MGLVGLFIEKPEDSMVEPLSWVITNPLDFMVQPGLMMELLSDEIELMVEPPSIAVATPEIDVFLMPCKDTKQR